MKKHMSDQLGSPDTFEGQRAERSDTEPYVKGQPRGVQRILHYVFDINIVVDEIQCIPKITHPRIRDRNQLQPRRKYKISYKVKLQVEKF